ncbi:glycosyltransferase family 92 protein F13G3.3-like isoform X2 [Euwallacea fornicatus]|uniref:glycosyltransferase family 92 protein F13G3.3-like isoform X2 n=1 Tax=Euwallacea fornicatus TaxID=995702 RepID=UPI00338DE5BF
MHPLERGKPSTAPRRSNAKFLVFSAFLDVRNTRAVTIIAVARTNVKKVRENKVWCQFWTTDTFVFAPKPVEAGMTIIEEHWGLPYSAYYINCPVDLREPLPEAVSVVTNVDQFPENLMKIIINYVEASAWDASKLSAKVEKIAVCVKPLHYAFNRIFELLEFLELHRIMGVDHFFLYNHTVGSQVNCLLEEYIKEGLVTVLPWQLPLVSQKEIRTEGIFASLNDCLLRTRHKYSHTIFIDFDEYILPTNNYNYRQFFDYLGNHYDITQKASFSFKNCFFYRQWPDDSEIKLFNDAIGQKLIVLRKTTRKTEFHNHRIRSKIIVRPELINMVGNHFVWKYFDKKLFGNMDVKPEEAFMHHYRVCEFGGDDCVKQPSVVDKTAYRYQNDLLEAVRTQYDRNLNACDLDKVED